MIGVKDGERQQKQQETHELGLTNLTKAFYTQQRSGIIPVVVRVRKVVVQDECLLPVEDLSPDHRNQDRNHPGDHCAGLGFQ